MFHKGNSFSVDFTYRDFLPNYPSGLKIQEDVADFVSGGSIYIDITLCVHII